MAGHSKWHNIQRRKGKQDAIRGQLFTKLSRDIYHAAKEGGGNPETNFRLKVALERGRQNNLSADSITRTIAKATGNLQGVTYEELVYEGYGPHGVAIMLEIVTDNRNRTAADVRHIFGKRGGNLGETGCVAWMFKRLGSITIPKASCKVPADDLFMMALDAGAADVRDEEEAYEIITNPEDFMATRNQLESSGFVIEDAELTYEPTMTVSVAPEQAEPLYDLVEALEANDDVQNVYANFEVAENL